MADCFQISDREIAITHRIHRKLWTVALDWLEQLTPEIEVGEHRITSLDDVVAKVIRKKPVNPAIQFFEAHEKMADVHFCLAGGEIIQFWPRESLTVAQPFDEVADVCLFQPPVKPHQAIMTPGMVLVLEPNDAHLPCVNAGYPSILKVVLKIPAIYL